ncbi:hypothetical protein LVJ94_10585 [Pendulispora rubella]|uniref:Bulb-type lectin domain-containing protein n=2 Tax=Pendulispora rubella TaxID=2741070 RepID=A0ABZ2LFY3_9BACT
MTMLRLAKASTAAFVQFALLGALGGTLAACSADGGTSGKLEGTEPKSFEEFVASTYKEPGESGLYIYDGDTPARSIEELREVYDKAFKSQQPLIVNRIPNRADVWDGERSNLRYCIGNGFGSNKTAVVDAMAQAAGNWESYAYVHFVYASDQDASCTSSNPNVIFDVNPTSAGRFQARAFFPSYPRVNRNILVDDSAFSSGDPLYGIMMHELGHTLGFRHEHTRPEAPSRCFEDNSWLVLTPYDRASVMHYPECNGTNTHLSFLSTSDAEGIAHVYESKRMARPVPPAACGIVSADHGLGSNNQGIRSCDGRFLLIMQSDGNLVLYQGNTALWASGTAGQPSYGAYMQGDGNLVIYSGLPRALWASGTAGNPGAYLQVQNDGNVVIYRSDHVPIWATNTSGH